MNIQTLYTRIYQQYATIPYREMRITWATICTLCRIILIPFIIYAFYMQQWVVALCLFVCAALTDLLDGLIARFYNQQTLLGAWLDPLADKLLMIATFITLAYTSLMSFSIPFWFLVLLIIKEVIQIVGALVLYGYCNAVVIQPTLSGKMATCVQSFFVILLTISQIWNIYFEMYLFYIFALLLFVTTVSFMHYMWYGIYFFYNNKRSI